MSTEAIDVKVKAAELLMSLRGKVLRRGDEGFGPGSYQYASSSYKEEGIIDPQFIFAPVDDNDIRTVIAYAQLTGVGIAIRTGGHHYTGASSTNGNNIQLDLSHTYPDFIWEDEDGDRVLARVGISTTLSKFLGRLKQQGRFVPVGQCSYVNLGGHVQTGGYGHLIRSFGLLADYVETIRVITATDAKVRYLRRGVDKDADLFYAILGGSPGNFGVITHVTLNVLRDEDYPLSRGLYGATVYKEERLKKLLDIMVEMDDDEDAPADYDFSVTVMGEREAEGKTVSKIVVFAQWANLPGGKPYDPALFNKIKDAVDSKWIPHNDTKWIDLEKPMSALCSLWVFPIAREFQLPYYKRTYITASKDLKKDGWAGWATGRLDKILEDKHDGLYACAQFSHVGGRYSRYRIGDPNNQTSLSWRTDSTFACTMDVFYDTGKPEVKAKAREWAETNDKEAVNKENGRFSKQDRRLLWGSKDLDLDATKEYYYDSMEKYNRLSAIKKKVDPDLIFTANKFAVAPHRLN